MTNEDLTKDIADDVASKSEDIAGTLGHRQRRASTAKGVDMAGDRSRRTSLLQGRGRDWRSRSENFGGHLKGADETDVRLNADRHLFEIITAAQPDPRP